MYGYHGKTLIVDLTKKQITWEPIDETVLRQFIGGTGLGSYLLFKHCPAGVDPLSPDNPLIFVTSPLVGSRLTTSSKYAVVTKSPLTGFIGDSLSSSFVATELKKTGCDALIIKGKSERPTLLYIKDGSVEFLDAADLVQMTTSQTETAVKNRLGNKARVICIGPAGENLVRFASISNDGGRHAGRTGPGAVMGSKNLKAIGLLGSISVPVFQRKELDKTGLDLTSKSLGPATEKYRTLGTAANISIFNRLGTLPTRNFQQSTFELAESISGETLNENHHVKTAHCSNCTIGCEQVVRTNDKKEQVKGRIEYESSFALGPLVGVADPNTLIRASVICDELGIDTISSGATIAWAMESFEKNLISQKDTNGIDLSFGNGEALLKVLELIANREGIGNLLAEGSKIASEKLGKNSSDWAMHVKGLEMPGYEPRSLKTMALGLAVSTRGACHNRSSSYEADFSKKVDRFKADQKRGQITMEGEDYNAVLDSMIWCKFLRKAFTDIYDESANIYTQVTGWEMTGTELQLVGQRINNLKKAFNIREGWNHSDDTLPPRILGETVEDGKDNEGTLIFDDLKMMIHSYYKARGWTEKGLIPDQKLRELDLKQITEKLINVG